MNKKFSTLTGCLAFGAALSTAVAAGPVNSANGHYEFRKANVMAAQTSTPTNTIDAQKWYQLRVYNPATKQYGYLVQTRDLETGRVWLRVVYTWEDEHVIDRVPLLPSLWRIDYDNDDNLSGGGFRFINKETNAALMFDQTFAVNAKGETPSKELSYTMVNGCVARWAWYQGDTQTSNFELLEPYAYFNNEKDSVMYMKADADGFVSSYKDVDENVLANGKVISSLNALQIKPVLADGIILDDYAFNSMIDYNKPSMDQYGRFKFYEPDGKLIDPTDKKGFVAHAMKADMNYQAELDRNAISNFYIQEMISLGVNIADMPQYENYTNQLAESLEKQDATKKELANENNKLDIVRTLLASKKQQKNDWSIKESERKAAFTPAYERVQAVATELNELVTTWANDENKTKEEGWDAAKKEYDAAWTAYSEALTDKGQFDCLDYTAIADAAADVYTNAKELVANLADDGSRGDAWWNFNPSNADATAELKDQDLWNAQLEAVRPYGEAASELAEATAAVKGLKADKKEVEGTIESLNGDLQTLDNEIAALQEKIASIDGGNEKTDYLTGDTHTFLRLKYIENTDDLSKNKQYLMVDTAYWQTDENKTVNPKDGDLDIINSTPDADDNYAIAARYYFQLTYYPSQDSIVVEPLNASDMSETDAKSGVAFKDSKAGKQFIYDDDINDEASQVSNTWTSKNEDQIVVRLKELNTSDWCLTATSTDIEFPLNARIGFDNPYDYLVRTTLNPGLYFIQSTNNNGKYLVANLNGNLMYDMPNSDQNYNWMPSTMFVVEKQGCEGGDLIEVRNREYGVDRTTAFEGQLYAELDENGEPTGNVFTINAQDYWMAPSPELDTKYNKVYVKDTYKFIPVTSEYALTNPHHGYKYLNADDLAYNEYAFRYNRYNAESEYMNVGEGDFLFASEGDNSYYELGTSYYAPGYTNGKRNQYAIAEDEFGYGAGVKYGKDGKTLPQLVRQAYTLKVKDVNLVDNDTTYVGINNAKGEKDYFVARGISDILDNGLAGMGAFYLKIDQYNAEGDTCYALINTLNKGYATHFENGYQRANVLSTGNVAEEDLDNTQEDNIDAFALTTNNRPLYRSIEGNTVSFFRTVGGVDQKLFEDATNQTGASVVKEGFGYLGLAQEQMTTNGTEAWTVDAWVTSNARMPQYMFALEMDSVADGYWCENNTHGYFATKEEADDADENHYVFYNGYTEGRYLVNLADSVVEGSQAYHNADQYTFNGRAVRLGFVEGVHMYITADEAKEINNFLGTEIKAGEYFFTPINGKTLADLKDENGYIIPKELFNEDNVKMNATAEKATHNDWTFSLRLMNDDIENFFIESNLDGVSSIGSMTGAWIKIDNNCPVLNYISGNHQTITAEDLTPDNVTDGQLFSLTASNTDDPTANDEISTSEVTVIAGNGQITINGAAGKKVVVSNILGQVVANTVLTSDNATIAAPQGVVVVAVEGEEAVKAIVK